MKKFILSFLFVAWLVPAASSQDTVRYGDPWYQFYGAPDSCAPVNHPPFISNYLNYFWALPCFTDGGTGINMELRGYFGYPNERHPIYGLAVVMDSLPGPEWNYKVTLLRGIEYHLIYDADFGKYGLVLDSLYQQDTIDQWANTLIKSCQFEFYRRDQQGEITTESRNCFEFYFDNPILKTQRNDGFADTFFVGITCNFPYGSNLDTPFIPKMCAACASDTNIILQFHRICGTNTVVPHLHDVKYQAPGFCVSHISPSIPLKFFGGIFPIIERRCSVPRGLALSADSLSALWRSDTDAELFQLSVCHGMTEPDSGLLFTTTDTSQSLPAFHPDSTYRLYLRKQCAFRQDSVWSDWSAPLVIASRTTEGIGEAENNGWTIDINPNPATKQVHVATNFSLTQIEAFDEQGRLVQTLPATGLKATLDVSSWPRGTYLLRIHTPLGTATKKLLVQ